MYLKLRKNKFSEISVGNFENSNWNKTGYIILITILLFIPGMKNVYGCSAAFNVDNASPVVGETINFNSTDDQGNSTSWNFGAGATPATSTAKTVAVTYSSAGDKTVSLKVTWTLGSDTQTKIISVGLAPTPGTIGSDQTINYGAAPGALTSTAAGGGSGTITYEWQTNASGSYTTIGGATGAGYQPPALTATTSYQRRTVAVYGGKTRYSAYTTPVTITVRSAINAGAIQTTGETICYNGDPGVIGSVSNASGGDGNLTYQWQSSSDAGFTSPITINSNTSSYDPPSNLTATTYYRRQAKDGSTPTFITSSGVWEVYVISMLSVNVTDKTDVSCFNEMDGRITVLASGGSGTYQFSVHNGDIGTWVSGSNPYTFEGLHANEQYKIRVQDSNGCTSPAIP